jgi:hypothetical protein
LRRVGRRTADNAKILVKHSGRIFLGPICAKWPPSDEFDSAKGPRMRSADLLVSEGLRPKRDQRKVSARLPAPQTRPTGKYALYDLRSGKSAILAFGERWLTIPELSNEDDLGPERSRPLEDQNTCAFSFRLSAADLRSRAWTTRERRPARPSQLSVQAKEPASPEMRSAANFARRLRLVGCLGLPVRLPHGSQMARPRFPPRSGGQNNGCDQHVAGSVLRRSRRGLET